MVTPHLVLTAGFFLTLLAVSGLLARRVGQSVIAAFLVTADTTDILRETIPAFTVGYVLLTRPDGGPSRR